MLLNASESASGRAQRCLVQPVQGEGRTHSAACWWSFTVVSAVSHLCLVVRIRCARCFILGLHHH